MACGDRLRQYRELCEMTQDQLGKKADIPSTTISRMENGLRKITLDEAVRLAEVLRVSLAALAGTDETHIPRRHERDRQEVAMTLRAMADQLEAVAS